MHEQCIQTRWNSRIMGRNAIPLCRACHTALAPLRRLLVRACFLSHSRCYGEARQLCRQCAIKIFEVWCTQPIWCTPTAVQSEIDRESLCETKLKLNCYAEEEDQTMRWCVCVAQIAKGLSMHFFHLTTCRAVCFVLCHAQTMCTMSWKAFHISANIFNGPLQQMCPHWISAIEFPLSRFLWNQL